jgi:hypothetical protein
MGNHSRFWLAFWFSSSQILLYYLTFESLNFERILMMVIPEMRRAH